MRTVPSPASFNPLPPPKRGETRSLQSTDAADWRFQSTPPAEARGDETAETRPVSQAAMKSFNPLPPPKRGETQIPDPLHRPRGDGAVRSFNPLPPPKRGETRPLIPGKLPGAQGRHIALSRTFQSTPPAEARGDATHYDRIEPAELERFNPLPPPKRGETEITDTLVTIETAFQSTPPAEARGDRQWGPYGRMNFDVSIHSPRRSEGRRPTPEGRIQQ